MEAHLGNVNRTLQCSPVQLFHIGKKPVEIQPFSVNPSVDHCLEDKSIIGAGGKSKRQSHCFSDQFR